MEEIKGYLLESTGDRTDRKEEIEKILREKGSCILGTGDFYVSGVAMPERTCIFGLGEKSRVILLPEVKEGAAISLSAYCRVASFTLTGCTTAFDRPTAIGKRHGVAFVGNARLKDGSPQPRHVFIHSLRIVNFSGGGLYFADTGVNLEHSSVVENVQVHNCGVGIYIPIYSEFHRFTNVQSNRNLYGCINGGGNNVFHNCAFDGNTEGFLIDNSKGDLLNPDHGSVIGCTFNHSDFNKGVGIRVLGAKHGFIFTACQCFYSTIVVENSRGVQFTNFNGGKEPITVKGGGLVRFSGCVWQKKPEFILQDAHGLVIDHCYTQSGEEITLDEE